MRIQKKRNERGRIQGNETEKSVFFVCERRHTIFKDLHHPSIKIPYRQFPEQDCMHCIQSIFCVVG